MNILTIILGSGGFGSLVLLVIYLMQRPKQVAETGLVTGQSWEAFTKQIQADRDQLLGRLREHDSKIAHLTAKAAEDRRFRFYAISYIRVLIAWGTNGGGATPPIPPAQLDLDDPDEDPFFQNP